VVSIKSYKYNYNIFLKTIIIMSFNFEKVGKPLAMIDGGKLNGKEVSIGIVGEEGAAKSYSQIPLQDGKFQQVPNPKAEREILYITGPSGSGKSTYTLNYCKEFKKKKKKSDIYLFSALKEDETLDKIKTKRMIIDDSLIENPIDAEEFKNSLVIFDDIDVISNKDHREAVYKILNQILEVGRHHKTSCIVTNHLPTGGKDTRRIINESHSVTYFPQSGSAGQMKRLLQDYLGLDTATLKKIRKLNTRWATVFKNFPMAVMTEKLIFSLNPDDDSESEIDSDSDKKIKKK
jgi:energy-coupling factor transporter ATP-binding protein EcfA2